MTSIKAAGAGPILPRLTEHSTAWTIGGAVAGGALGLVIGGMAVGSTYAPGKLGAAILFTMVAGSAVAGAIAGHTLAGNPGVKVDPNDFSRLTADAQAAARAHGLDPDADVAAWANDIFAKYDRNRDDVIDLRVQDPAFETEAIRTDGSAKLSREHLFTSADRLGDRDRQVTRGELVDLIGYLKHSSGNLPSATLVRPEGQYIFPERSFLDSRALVAADIENPEIRLP